MLAGPHNVIYDTVVDITVEGSHLFYSTLPKGRHHFYCAVSTQVM